MPAGKCRKGNGGKKSNPNSRLAPQRDPHEDSPPSNLVVTKQTAKKCCLQIVQFQGGAVPFERAGDLMSGRKLEAYSKADKVFRAKQPHKKQRMQDWHRPPNE